VWKLLREGFGDVAETLLERCDLDADLVGLGGEFGGEKGIE
jgi:hypothetical protein